MIQIISGHDEWLKHENAWRTLFRLTEKASPFQSWEWVTSWLDNLGRKSDLFIVAFVTSDGVRALLPLRREVGKFGLRRVTFLQSCPLTCPDHLGWLGQSEDVSEAQKEFSAFLQTTKDFDLIDLKECVSSLNGEDLLSRLVAKPWRGTSYAYGNLPYLSLPKTWDEYLGGLQAKSRETLRRKERLADRAGASLEMVTKPLEIEKAFSSFMQLHADQWNERNSFFLLPDVQKFHLDFVRSLVESQTEDLSLRLYFLMVSGRRVAALYGFIVQKTFFYYQAGRSRDSSPVASSGQVLMAKVIQSLIREDMETFDFLRGDEEYKNRWTKEVQSDLRLLSGRGLRGNFFVWAGRLRRTASNVVFRLKNV